MKDRVTEVFVLEVLGENFRMIKIVTASNRACRNWSIVTTIGKKFVFGLWLVASLTVHVRKDL